jgi:hypothetical protein
MEHLTHIKIVKRFRTALRSSTLVTFNYVCIYCTPYFGGGNSLFGGKLRYFAKKNIAILGVETRYLLGLSNPCAVVNKDLSTVQS